MLAGSLIDYREPASIGHYILLNYLSIDSRSLFNRCHAHQYFWSFYWIVEVLISIIRPRQCLYTRRRSSSRTILQMP